MTEAEWLAATDPSSMLESLRARGSERKWRLLACGYCRWRCVGGDIPRPIRHAIEGAERLADGDILQDEANRIHDDVRWLVGVRGCPESEVALMLLNPDGWKAILAVHWYSTSDDGLWIVAA